MATRRLGFLDSLRGLATVDVVVFHLPLITSPALPIPEWAGSFVLYGGAGVTLFFVISAYSLCLTMPGHVRTGAPLASFFIKRLLRIAPLFYAVLAYTIFAVHRNGGPLPSARMLLANLTFVFNLVPSAADSLVFAGWTLGVEMLFYVVFPAFNRVLVGVTRKLSALLLSLTAYPLFLGVIGAFALPPDVATRYGLLTIFLYLPAFAMGMLVHDLSREARLPPKSVLLALAAVIYTLLAAARLNVILAQAQWQAICFGLVLLAMPVPGLPALWGRIGGFVGKISYSVYLLHGPLIMMANPLFQRIYRLPLPVTPRFLLAIAAALAIILPVSWISYQLIERPFILLGKVLVARYVRARGVDVAAVG